MKTNPTTRSFRNAPASKYAIPVLFALAASCAQGALTVQTQINNGAAPSVLQPLAGDLLETAFSSSTGENLTQLVRNGAFTGLPTDNTANFPAQVLNINGPTPHETTFNLNLSVATNGYDITVIQAYSAWADNRTSQSYQIFYALASAPTVFVQLGGDIEVSASNSSVITRSADSTPGVAILTNVSSIRFSYYDGAAALDGPEAVYRELDVVGVASAIPEPTTSMLGLSGALLFLYRRRS